MSAEPTHRQILLGALNDQDAPRTKTTAFHVALGTTTPMVGRGGGMPSIVARVHWDHAALAAVMRCAFFEETRDSGLVQLLARMTPGSHDMVAIESALERLMAFLTAYGIYYFKIGVMAGLGAGEVADRVAEHLITHTGICASCGEPFLFARRNGRCQDCRSKPRSRAPEARQRRRAEARQRWLAVYRPLLARRRAEYMNESDDRLIELFGSNDPRFDAVIRDIGRRPGPARAVTARLKRYTNKRAKHTRTM
jgi:hypothetical protein